MLEDLSRFKVLSGQSLSCLQVEECANTGYFGLGEQMPLVFLLQSYIVAAGK